MAEIILSENAYAFVFPGQGSCSEDMMKNISQHPRYEELQQLFDTASRILSEETGNEISLADILNTEPERLSDPVIGPVAIVTTGLVSAIMTADNLKKHPEVVMGHSLGEITALAYAGSLDFEHAIRFTAQRGKISKDVSANHPGGLIAGLRLDEQAEQNILDEVNSTYPGAGVELANLNAPGQVVYAVSQEGKPHLMQTIKNFRGSPNDLHISFPSHSSHMADSVSPLTVAATTANPINPQLPIYSPTSRRFDKTETQVIDTLGNQMIRQVDFRGSVQELYHLGIQRMYEINAGKPVLQGLIKRINPGITVFQSEAIIPTTKE